jgi:predicted Zn-dependent protease
VIRHPFKAPLAGLLLMLLASAPLAAKVDLPALGEPANQALSPRQEAEIGRELMARARTRLDLNRDAEIAAYIDALGQKLARHSDAAPVDGFTFFVVNDPRINAFAGPGGYIGLHAGLMLEAETEAQLAGVIAHEIAHVGQRHIARTFAAAQRNSYKTLAAVLAGLILGSQNPEAAEAAVASGVAAEQQARIDYTRAHEYEADRVGIALLARAGYAPSGMTEFFRILMRAAGPGGSQVPEFLRTHPLSQNRIAETASRARDLRQSEQRRDSLAFHLMRARLAVLTADQPAALYKQRQQAATPTGARAAAAHRYGQGVLALRLERPERALAHLEPLHEDAPENLHYALARARAQQAAGRSEAALATWRNIQQRYPTQYPVAETGATLLLTADRPAAAVDLLTGLIRGEADVPPEAWRQLARAAEAAGRSARSHEALGEYYVRVDRFAAALEQLNIALEGTEAETPGYLRLQARIEQVENLRREQLASNPID